MESQNFENEILTMKQKTSIDGIATETVDLAKIFYVCDHVSRIAPGRRDAVMVLDERGSIGVFKFAETSLLNSQTL